MKTVGVIFGGDSPEHNVSIRSASTIVKAVSEIDNYKCVPIYISEEGEWFYVEDPSIIHDCAKSFTVLSTAGLQEVYLDEDGSRRLQVFHSDKTIEKIDAVFPIVHGSNGEDGSLQGLLQVAKVPYVGPSVYGSAVAMDKDIAKRLFAAAGIKTSRYLAFRKNQQVPSYEELSKRLSMNLYVKPARAGSSVGVTRVSQAKELKGALSNAFLIDDKILIEEEIVGKELECAIQGKFGEIFASEIGEILAPDEGYTFDEKYSENSITDFNIPVQLPDDLVEEIKIAAIKACEAIECEGMARVDFFLSDENELYINEINTLPGFTSISMYPKLMEVSGISLAELVKRLVESAKY